MIAAYIFVFALVVAYLETQIEGKNGWAAKLPTWRYPHANVKAVAQKTVHLVFMHRYRGKQITGYHLAMSTVLAMAFGFPFVYGYPVTWENISLQTSVYVLFVIVWDFLWFVINPYYTLQNFNRDKVWWHTTWIGRVPIIYLAGTALSFLLVLPYTFIYKTTDLTLAWLIYAGTFSIGTIVVMVAANCLIRATKKNSKKNI